MIHGLRKDKNVCFVDLFMVEDQKYSKVPPLRNCVIRISGLILLDKVPVNKKLARLIFAQFLLQCYIVASYIPGESKKKFRRL